MLDVFDAFLSAHQTLGHLKTDKTMALLKPQYYSATADLVKVFIDHCSVCHQKNTGIQKKKGARKPILSSEFRDRFQVDLIDMRTIRRRDVYGHMQRWIMTVKDHSTGLIYLAALPRKMAKYVATELEKYFGFVGYPSIFHTGMFSIVISFCNQILNFPFNISIKCIHSSPIRQWQGVYCKRCRRHAKGKQPKLFPRHWSSTHSSRPRFS
jgi:hypothetical protein